jgi:hypothetical protein
VDAVMLLLHVAEFIVVALTALCRFSSWVRPVKVTPGPELSWKGDRAKRRSSWKPEGAIWVPPPPQVPPATFKGEDARIFLRRARPGSRHAGREGRMY